jgi:hypothetical protein
MIHSLDWACLRIVHDHSTPSAQGANSVKDNGADMNFDRANKEEHSKLKQANQTWKITKATRCVDNWPQRRP